MTPIIFVAPWFVYNVCGCTPVLLFEGLILTQGYFGYLVGVSHVSFPSPVNIQMHRAVRDG
jgi:hypothetical protein